MEIRFNAVSGYGNEIYLDNINITANALGIHDQQNNSFFQVYPNPAGNSFNVEISSEKNAAIRIVIYDMMGNIVQSENKNVSEGKNYFPVNVSAFSEGIYLVQVIENGGVTTQRISILR